MAEEKRNIEFIETEQESQESRFPSVKEILSGNILTRGVVVKQLPFILFMVLLGIIYIANRYHAESLYRRMNQLENEIRNIRVEEVSITQKLMGISTPDKVEELVEQNNLGLKTLTEPPVILTKKSKRK